MFAVYVVGTAGSGKSLLAASLARWLGSRGENPVLVNLDPGADALPYEADVDVRDIVTLTEVMEKYGLGPNGALLLASDIAADRAFKLSHQISEAGGDYAILDTPGQMEIFAFRASGKLLVEEIEAEKKTLLYLFDGPFCSNPMNYAANLFLAAAVSARFALPQINVLTKSDLLERPKLSRILSWASSSEVLLADLSREPSNLTYLLMKNLSRAVSFLNLDFSLLACSAKTLDNFVSLHGALERVFTHGEKREV